MKLVSLALDEIGKWTSPFVSYGATFSAGYRFWIPLDVEVGYEFGPTRNFSGTYWPTGAVVSFASRADTVFGAVGYRLMTDSRIVHLWGAKVGMAGLDGWTNETTSTGVFYRMLLPLSVFYQIGYDYVYFSGVHGDPVLANFSNTYVAVGVVF